ncbi:Arc family DNA-binding protein [Rhodovulum sp. P5]|uniref:FitA-like ribbon-helix-helix domain-containing protein n=1 Tax=Rhodovulum sp. P5 TaxID=1564506 RepID=UPI0015600E43|nr:Arc family DNA-binding protein [Rhodovulum sp. P5]
MPEPRLNLRLSEDVKNWLAARAAANDRSMTAEVNRILKAAQAAERSTGAAQ